MTIPTGSAVNHESVNGLVVTTGSAAQARTAFAAFKDDLRLGSTSGPRLPA